jgi:hypothetical protein
MFKSILSKIIIYSLILVFVVPVIIFLILGLESKKQAARSGSPINTLSESQVVPMLTKEDVVRTFCNLINEGRISEAVGMMDIIDDTVKQSWGVYFNNFSKFELVDINNSKMDPNGNSFEVDINVTLKKNLTNLPIPNYGWENGVNKRWIVLAEKGNNEYKVSEIATGP